MSAPLLARLIEHIERAGPITFAEFMEAALYDPDDGFYSSTPVGPDGAFVTSPHVSGAFAVLIARQLTAIWETLGRPATFRVVEAGAGDGTLAKRILAATARAPGLGDAIAYVAVERGAAARRTLAEAGLDVRERIEDVPERFAGCIIANEVLDNLAFHRIRNRDGTLVEIKVDAARNTLIEIEDEPTEAALGALTHAPPPGEETIAAPGIPPFVDEVARVIDRGYALLFDYGATGVPGDPVRAYRDQRMLADVLADPGSRDITAGVDFSALASAARDAGLIACDPVTQADAMRALGLGEIVEEMRRAQAAAEEGGDSRTALRLYAERGRAALLADPAHVGGHLVLALASPGLPAPAIVG
jgi:SAM-dependent MidA family methyltransferase